MRLSTAIRLGAMLKPQAFGVFTDGIGTCAIGAAHEAVGFPLADFDADPFGWQPVLNYPVCPACGINPCSLTMPAHLNDDHYWTREQIADWVESIEQQHEQQAAAVQPQPVTVAQQ